MGCRPWGFKQPDKDRETNTHAHIHFVVLNWKLRSNEDSLLDQTLLRLPGTFQLGFSFWIFMFISVLSGVSKNPARLV